MIDLEQMLSQLVRKTLDFVDAATLPITPCREQHLITCIWQSYLQAEHLKELVRRMKALKVDELHELMKLLSRALEGREFVVRWGAHHRFSHKEGLAIKMWIWQLATSAGRLMYQAHHEAGCGRAECRRQK